MKKKERMACSNQILWEIIGEIGVALDSDESTQFVRIMKVDDKEVHESMTREQFLQETLEEVADRIQKDVLPLLKTKEKKNEPITNI